MKIRNVSNKIIHIGNKMLMPEAEIVATPDMKVNPAIKALAKMKMLELDDSEERIAAAVEQANKEAAAREAAEAAKKAAEEKAAARKAAKEAKKAAEEKASEENTEE